MPVDVCPRSDLPAAYCAHCRGHRGVEEEIAEMRRALRARGWILARVAGVCASCGEEFEAGVVIRAARGRRGGWVAECCSEVAGG